MGFDLDTDILAPLQGLPEAYRAFVFFRLARRTGCQSLFHATPALPESGSEAWDLLRTLNDLPEGLFSDLVAVLQETRTLSKPLLTGPVNGGPASAPNETLEAQASTPDSVPPETMEEFSHLQRFLHHADAFDDTDIILFSIRSNELTLKRTEFSIRDIKSVLRKPMSNPEGTIGSFSRKQFDLREVEEIPDTSPKLYRLTRRGRDRIHTLLSVFEPLDENKIP